MSKQPYYPNNWRAYKDTPDSFFFPISFEEFFDWKVAGWELPSSVCCIIRVEHKDSGKIKEYHYSNPRSAIKFCNKLMDQGHEFTIVDEEQVQQMIPSND